MAKLRVNAPGSLVFILNYNSCIWTSFWSMSCISDHRQTILVYRGSYLLLYCDTKQNLDFVWQSKLMQIMRRSRILQTTPKAQSWSLTSAAIAFFPAVLLGYPWKLGYFLTSSIVFSLSGKVQRMLRMCIILRTLPTI